MFGFVKKLFGTKQDRDVKKYSPRVAEINEEYERLRGVSNDELRGRTMEFRERIKEHLSGIDADIKAAEGEAAAEPDFTKKEDIYREIDEMKKERDKHLEVVLLEILPEAFAVVKETAVRFSNNETISVTATQHDRDLAANMSKSYVSIDGDQAHWKNYWTAGGGEIVWNMVHYDVQLIGGMVLHDGKIAEMQTGEGKTLVATLPAYLNGLSGGGVHVVTVNDYLAKRDCEWIGPIFEFLHLTIDCIDRYKSHSPERREAYACDITYGTNNEFGFDYLRDNMVRSADERVQAKYHYVMIDEVDSVLVDDARTPLIISGPVPQGSEEQEYTSLKPFVEKLMAAQRKMATEFLAEAKSLFKDGITGFEDGEAGMPLLRAHRAMPKYRPLIKFLSQEGVKVILQKAENHYMQEQSKHMHLVDAELLFTIDEKNRSVDLTDKGVEYVSKGNVDAGFFVMPDLASDTVDIDMDEELSDSEKDEAKTKLAQDYGVKAQRLHAMSQLLKAYTLFEKDEEYIVMDGQVKIVDEQTGRMMDGRRYSDGLHQALESKENVKIGDITQTYATVTLQNFFRMYHKLAGMTGTAETEAKELWDIYKLDVAVIPTNKPIARDDRDDMVYKTEREKFNAVIEDITKLSAAGRPILVGTTSVDISEKLSRILNLRGIQHNVLNAKQHQREAEVVASAGKPGAVTIATNMAGRGTDIKIGPEVKAAGGLAIIGTERHDSRRVDRQLRGRAGRQGDVGSSQFYVSLEDDLMRMFQSERIAKLMDKMGHEDGEVIQHSMVSKSIERAQKRLEENNFGIRKRLLEYDDVMNIQREAIYKKRNHALSGDRLSVDINNMFAGAVESVVMAFKPSGNYEAFKIESIGVLGITPKIDEADFKDGKDDDIINRLEEQFRESYARKEGHIIEALMPHINNIQENESHRYTRISIPFTDRSRMLPISADIETAVNTGGSSIMRDIEKAATLAIIDEKWKEHLRGMDELKDSVQAASFEQKDPLVIFKMEAYNLFENLIYEINADVTAFLSRGTIVYQDGRTLQEAREQRTDMSKVQTSRASDAEQSQRRAVQIAGGVGAAQAQRQPQPKPETFRREAPKVKRNDPCPCGSGKKYKQCHGK
ncbi:MAG: preprotein translocase subunit SecA [Saprospiraceae bacterium]|jgi:preprotein translocase subunit SecA